MDSHEVRQDTNTALDQASLPFEGRWHRLISTTNWEKGQIIFQWRSALKAANVPVKEFSDEAWAQRVGGVTGQHIGRLRRVHERFGETHKQYDGLYWSHFQAAQDWDDAEMWLEGTIQNRWSVAKMRKARWEALGAPEELKPRDEDIISMEINEDLNTREDYLPTIVESPIQSFDQPMSPAAPDFGEEDDLPLAAREAGANIYVEDEQNTVPFVRPFENLAELPEDLADAFEAFKLSIIRHKADQWQEISREDLLGTLESLKELVLAPAGEQSSF